VGCGLILEKMRGLCAKCREMEFSRNYFVEEKSVDQVHGLVDRTGVHGSVDRTGLVHHGPAAIAACRSSPELSLRRFGVREVQPRGGGGDGQACEFNDGVASARKGGGEGTVRAKRRSAGGVGVFTEGRAAFYKAEAMWVWPGAFNGRC
jgi:hypothetical protein